MKRLSFAFKILFWTILLSTPLLAQIKTDQFFPDSTKGFFAISDVETLRQNWQQTNLGKVIASDSFTEFRESLIGNIENSWMGRFGMTLEDTLALASGEVGGGVIASPGKKPGFAIIIDVKGKQKEVSNFITKLIRQSVSSKSGTSKKEAIQGPAGTLEVTVLTLPPDDRYPAPRTIYYAQIKNYLISADQKEIVETLLSNKGKSLASVPAYIAIMNRCQEDFLRPHEANFRFFANPLEFGEAIYALNSQNSSEKRGSSPFDVLAKQGFNQIQGVGGTLDLATDDFEWVSRVKVYIPAEMKSSLKIFSFADQPQLTPPAWVGDDVNRTSIIRVDLLNVFNNIGPLFNEFLETPDVWEDTLQSLEKDERGPKVNLKTQLIANLGNQISTSRTFKNNEEKYVGMIEIKKGKSAIIAEVFHRMFDTDPDFKQEKFENDVIWLYAPQKRDLNHSSRSSQGKRSSKQNVPSKNNNNEEVLEIVKNIFYVSEEGIFFSNDKDTFIETFKNVREGKTVSIETSQDYQLIQNVIDKACGHTNHYFQAFSGNHNGIRTNYELIREGKFMEAKTFLARVMKAIFSASDPRVNSTIKVDGSKLPPFETIESWIGPSGAFGKTEEDGSFFRAFGIPSVNNNNN